MPLPLPLPLPDVQPAGHAFSQQDYARASLRSGAMHPIDDRVWLHTSETTRRIIDPADVYWLEADADDTWVRFRAVLIINGQHDQIAGNVEDWRTVIPHCETHEIPGRDHPDTPRDPSFVTRTPRVPGASGLRPALSPSDIMVLM